MIKIHKHIIHHTKRAIHHSKKILHHGVRITHQHKHALLAYAHIFLLIICFGYYNINGNIFAQEIIENTTIQQEQQIQETDQAVSIEETSAIETGDNTTEVFTGSEFTETTETIIEQTRTNEITTITGTIIETGNIQTGVDTTGIITTETGNNTTEVLTGSEFTGTIETILEQTGTNEITSITGTIIITGNTQTGTNNTETTGKILQINTPLDLSGLLVWLDANSYESFSFTGNNLVTLWQDKRNFAPKAFMDNLNKCPLYVTGVVNNRPALFFDDQDDGMQTNITLDQPYTMFLVYNRETIHTDYANMLEGGIKNRFIGFQNNDFIYYASGQINFTTPRNTDEFRIINITSDQNETNVFMNNKNITEHSGFVQDPIKLGLGAINNNKPLGGYVAEIIIYHQKLSSEEIRQINIYLFNKYSPFISKGLPLLESKKNETIIEESDNNQTTIINTGDTESQENIDNPEIIETEMQSESFDENNTTEDNETEIQETEVQETLSAPSAQEETLTENNKIEVQETLSIPSTNTSFSSSSSVSVSSTTSSSNIGTTQPETTIIENNSIWGNTYFTQAYKLNQQDFRIITLKQLLKKIGLYNNDLTDIYTTPTIEAVYRFQVQKGLIGNNKRIRGYMGPATRYELNILLQNYTKEELENTISTTIVTDKSENIPEKTETESILNSLGFNIFENTLLLGDTNSSIEDSTLSVEETKNKIRNKLLSKGFITQKSLTHDIDENILVGNTGIDLSEEKGKLLLPVILQTSNNQDTVEVEIPEGTTFNNDSGNAYTGIIEAPEIYDISKKLDNIDTISTIKVGADESIKLTDNSGNKINATIRMPVPTNIDTGDTIIVNYSQDGEHWYHQDNVAIIEIDGKPYVSFQTDHFTIFSLGIWSGSFVINNDATSTTGLSVTLNSVASGATQMRFGNTITERDAASWTGYKTGFNWTLSGVDGDGIKRVYAQFSGNNLLRNVADSIIYDTSASRQTSGLYTHLDGTTGGTVFTNKGIISGIVFTGINGPLKTTESGEDVIFLDGVDDYIENTSGFITGYPFTISAWIKTSRVNTTQSIVLFGNSATNNSVWGIELVNANAVAIGGSKLSTSTTTLLPNTRYHIMGVFESSSSRIIYVDNQNPASPNSANVNFSTTNPRWRIGRHPGSSTTNLFSGYIDDVRIYNKVLSATERESIYMITPSLDTLTTFSTTPTLYGTLPTKISSVTLSINGNTYYTTGTTGGKWKTLPITTGLNAGTYDVKVNYTNIYGKTGSVTYTGGLVIKPSSLTGLRIEYSPMGWTSGSVISTLTGLDPTYMIINNGGSEKYTFTGNGSFTYQYIDKVGTTGYIAATVTGIDKIAPTFTGVASGITYTGSVTINFYDEHISGAILSGINTNYYNENFANNTEFYTSGTYILTVFDLAGNKTGAIFTIQIPLQELTLEQIITNKLITLGYQTTTSTLTTKDPDTLVGSTDINFSGLTGNLLVPIILQSSNTISGQISEVEIQGGTILQNTGATPFTGILEVPVFQNTDSYSGYLEKTILSAMDVGSINHIFLKDTGYSDTYAIFRMPVPEKNIGDLIDIYSSEDGIIFEYLSTVHVESIGGYPYVVFESNHFSVIVTAANNSISISADKAANSTSGASYTTLSNIIITEANNTDFAANQTNTTLILTAPENWKFNTGAGSVTYMNGRDITATSLSITEKTLTITLSTDSNANKKDTITLSNIQIQAITGNILPSAGDILRTSANPGTASIIGITNDVTSFGAISQTFGSLKYLAITLPGETFIGGYGNTGTTQNQTTHSGFVIPSISAADQFYNIVTSYSGSKTLSYTGAGIPALYTTGVTFTNGQSTTPLNTTFLQSKTGVNISVSDGTISGPTSSLFDVIGTPTANILYSINSGTCYSGTVTATLTGYSEPITITNNSGSNQYTFSGNGSFTFQFINTIGITGSSTATVNWICTEPLSIGGPAMISSGFEVADTMQIIEQKFSNEFWINDPIGADSGYYTTIAITNLSGTYNTISNSLISFKASGITTLEGTYNPRVSIDSGLLNYTILNNPITYIHRDPDTNNFIRGKYGDAPRLQIMLKAYENVDNYHATINYTLYEN